MTTQEKRAANRRNAMNSTGPRSNAGKARASRNARRHGLSVSVSAAQADAAAVEELARRFAGARAGPAAMRLARAAAAARLDTRRVRSVKMELMRRAVALGTLQPPKPFTRKEIRLLLRSLYEDVLPEDPANVPMPSAEDACEAEGVRRVLPELARLDRYERRASSRWHVAMARLRRLKRFPGEREPPCPKGLQAIDPEGT